MQNMEKMSDMYRQDDVYYLDQEIDYTGVAPTKIPSAGINPNINQFNLFPEFQTFPSEVLGEDFGESKYDESINPYEILYGGKSLNDLRAEARARERAEILDTTFTIYGISWVILLSLIVISRFRNRSFFKRHSKWYVYVIAVLFAPLVVVVMVPYELIDYIKSKRIEKLIKKQEEERERKRIAFQNFHSASNHDYENDYIKVAVTLFNEAERYEPLFYELYKKIDGQDSESNLLSCLDCLKIHQGWILYVDLCKKKSSGDVSRLMITNGEISSSEIWDHINVKDEPMGAWQVYLLDSLWHQLPLFGHAKYYRRTYFFKTKTEDLLNKHFENEKDHTMLKSVISSQSIDLTPKISKNNDLYYVTCYYWSDWQGLVRESVEIKIVDNKAVSISKEETTLYKYHCGIHF